MKKMTHVWAAMRHGRAWLPIVALTSLALLASACSTGTGSASPGRSATAADPPEDTGGHAEEFSLEMPADPADADRVVEVR